MMPELQLDPPDIDALLTCMDSLAPTRGRPKKK
jgi:hypothetical protein